MKGAIIGDIAGSVYEFNNVKTKDFGPLITARSYFTDDTVLTVAVAQGLRAAKELSLSNEEAIKLMAKSLRGHTIAYPHRGYGGGYRRWARDPDAEAYNSCGNGSAMRVSAAAHYATTLEECLALAKLSALPTHNHPDGIAGAQAVAGATFLAKQGASKQQIKQFVEQYYPIRGNVDRLRRHYEWCSVCDGTVQAGILAFLDSVDFEDAIRNAISLGGDSDTIAAITGAIAEYYYGVPDALWEQAKCVLDKYLIHCAEQA